jgi:hypothetical protein
MMHMYINLIDNIPRHIIIILKVRDKYIKYLISLIFHLSKYKLQNWKNDMSIFESLLLA